MRITAQSWNDYIRRLRLVNEAAAKEMTQYMLLHPDADFEALIDFAYGVSTRYGEAAATPAKASVRYAAHRANSPARE